MSELHRITSNPAVLAGKPTVRGLRISVSDILDLLASRFANHTVIEAAEKPPWLNRPAKGRNGVSRFPL